MLNFSEYVAQGNAWLFLPVAVVLGALHGLEPGHSKTMMAAFIVAIRGTVAQAVLLGLSATLSHSALIWLLAFVGLHYSGKINAETAEPWLQVATGVIVIGMAAWMAWRVRRAQQPVAATHSDHHSHDHAHSHSHGPGEPMAHAVEEDEHSRQHAREWQERFAEREVTTGQIIIFGLTGGLLPCPSAFAVLLVCLQLKEFVLGFALVLAFSLGLALTLVAVGTLAALSVRHATQRYQGFHRLAARLPYASAALMSVIGLFVLVHGVQTILR